MARQEIELKFKVGERIVTVKAMDSVGPEDLYEVQFRAVLHRYATGEDVIAPAGRDAKDWIVKNNLVI
jgi:hypothetical protein